MELDPDQVGGDTELTGQLEDLMAAPDPDASCWWQQGVAVDPERLALVDRAWRHFAEHHEWVPHWDVRREFDQGERDLDVLLNDWKIITAIGDPLRLVPTVPALLYLEDVRNLLAPLPRVLGVSLERFLENPLDENSPARPRLAFSEVRPLWGADAELAMAFLRGLDTPLRFTAWDQHDATHYPNHESLLYAKAQTLADVFAAKWGPPFAHLASPLGEPHLTLIRAIFEHVRTRGDWPIGVPFAIAYNATAYVPRLVNELSQAGFTSAFNTGAHGHLHLRWRTIHELGLTDAAFRLVRASIETYSAQLQPGPVPIRSIGERAQLPVEDATALFLLLADVWFQLGERVADPSERTIQLREEIRSIRRVATWAEYVRNAHPEERPRVPAAAGVPLGSRLDPEWLGADGVEVAPLAGLRCEFEALEAMEDRQQAGLLFERFLNRLFAHFDLQPGEAFRVVGEQIDGSFVLDSSVYLVEAKWTRGPVGNDQLSVFDRKVGNKSRHTRGLFISVNGFTPDGVMALVTGGLSNFMMLDGAHLRSVLSGQVLLPDLLRAQLRRWHEQGKPYQPGEP